jgi:hypothetical protein
MKCFGYTKDKTALKKLERLKYDKCIAIITEGESTGMYKKLVNTII